MKNSEYSPFMAKSFLSQEDVDLVKDILYKYIDKDYSNFIKHENGMRQIEFKDSEVYKIVTKQLEELTNKKVIQLGLFFSRYINFKGKSPELHPHLDNYNPKTDHGLTFTYILNSSIDWDIYAQSTRFPVKHNDIVILSGSTHAHWRPKIEFKDNDYYDIIVGHFLLDGMEQDLVPDNYKEIMQQERQKYWGLWNDSKQS